MEKMQDFLSVREELELKFSTFQNLVGQGLTISKIAEEMNISRQSLTNLRKIKELIASDSLLEELVYTEVIAPDTARKAYQEYGYRFIENLERSYQYSLEHNLPTITPKVIEVSMLSAKCVGRLSHLSEVVEDFAEVADWVNNDLKTFVSADDRKKARQEIKEFWQELKPKINTLDNTVDLGTVPLDKFNNVNHNFRTLISN